MSKFFQFNCNSEINHVINTDYIIYFGASKDIGIFLQFHNEKNILFFYNTKEERDKDYVRLTEFVLKIKHKSE